MNDSEKIKTAISILKYNPMKAAQELYYPSVNQNREVTHTPLEDIFDYTPEQRQAAADYITEQWNTTSETEISLLSHAQIEGVRDLMQRGFQYPELRKTLMRIWSIATGF
jgi:hypothetical protein